VIFGHVRDDFPYVSIVLPGFNDDLTVEFVLDTGFDGWLALPPSLTKLIDAIPVDTQTTLLPGGVIRRAPAYEMKLDWQGTPLTVEVLEIAGRPLLGTKALRDNLIQIEMTDGGEVSVEPLD
jgi:clan AA aspartic protease